MAEEKFPSLDRKKSFGKITREKVSGILKISHNIIQDTAQTTFEILREAFRNIKNQNGESEYLIPILVEYSLYGADDVGRDLGEVSRGILEGVDKTAKELHVNANDWIERTARAMLLESDWRDIDLRIVIESYIRKSVPNGKELVKKIFISEKTPENTRKAA